MTAPKPTLISFEHVHVAYPGARREALVDVSLDIPSGQHVCILGGNGSGKSTLLQLVNALALPTNGSVRVCGMDTRDAALALDIRSRTASVFQHPEDQMVTSVVADDVAFGPENLRVPQPRIVKRVDAALAAVGMSACAQSDPSDLSGGQTQRVAIAGALATEPEIILFDEPCSMLDTEGRADVRSIITGLSARGITILHVTHFMEDALAADRVIVLERGHIAFDGTAEDLFAQPDLVSELELEMPRPALTPRAPADDTSACERNEKTGGGEKTRAASEAKSPSPAPTTPTIVFDHVSFSYAHAANPRKRSRRCRLFSRSVKSQNGSTDVRSANGQTTGGMHEAIAPLALDDLSFEAHPGTLTALIGRTGSGKSTTAELACALKLPTLGTVRITGIDTADLSRRRELRRMVGYVAQLPERQLFAETVFDDVAFGPRNLGLSPEEVADRVRSSLASVNLEPTDELLATSPFALSGGQQRSVALAGVLAMRQPVLVLDEPMAGLDPAGRTHVRALLRELKRSGTTLLMVTHSMEDVAELADHIIELDCGHRVDALPTTLTASSRGEVRGHGPAR